MISWEPKAEKDFEPIIEVDPELALLILTMIERIAKKPTMGELVLRPDHRYYSDPEGRFRISYVVLQKPRGIHIVVVRKLRSDKS